jgi:hypothetical protein
VVQIPAEFADALAPLDGSLTADGIELRSLLAVAIHEIHDDLGRISEDSGNLPIEELRELSGRLGAIIAAAEAVA